MQQGRVQSRLGYQLDESGGSLPAVVSSTADHILVVVGETDVRHVSRVTKVALMFGL